MNERIRKLAEKAGIKNDCDGIWCNADQLQRFAELIAAHERKECANICERHQYEWCDGMSYARAIRARGEA